MYSGITVTWNGSIIVARTTRNVASLPLHRILESAYATGMHETTTPIVDSVAITNVFLVYVNSGILWKTSVKFRPAERARPQVRAQDLLISHQRRQDDEDHGEQEDRGHGDHHRVVAHGQEELPAPHLRRDRARDDRLRGPRFDRRREGRGYRKPPW
jgi:hypothetical protein